MDKNNTGIILAGGVGSRMGNIDCPKQYLLVHGRPIIDYCLCVFECHSMVNDIVIVADKAWHEFINEWLEKSQIKKFLGYALPGETRQLSILNGLRVVEEKAPSTTGVIIHDAARPLVTETLISNCLAGLESAEGVMPILPLKDTCYQSVDGKTICGFLPRNQLFAGQAPEAFRFPLYLERHLQMDSKKLKEISGSSELAYKTGMKVAMVNGSECNFKITTKEDIALLEKYLSCGEEL